MDFTKRGRPSPAMVVAVVALVFAMIGTAVAGTDVTRLTNKKVKAIAGKVADKELRANIPGSHVGLADSATNAGHADNATTAANADNLGGQPASAYASSSSTRWASVTANGGIVADENKGITQANVTNAAQGVYCIDGLNPAPIAVQATLRYVSNPNHGTVYAEIKPSGGSPCTGSQVGILTFSNSDDNSAASKPFNVVLFSP